MADFKVGDLVKKVRGNKHIGHQGWVTAVEVASLSTDSDVKEVGLQVTGLPKRFVDVNGVTCSYFRGSFFEKVVPTGEDKSVPRVAPVKELA